MKRVYVQSFGCRASQADGAAIEAALEDTIFTVVRDRAWADLVVLNTCTVTHAPMWICAARFEALHRDHPQTDILVTGCYAQRAPEELADLKVCVGWLAIPIKLKLRIVSLGPEEYHGQMLDIEVTFSAHAEFVANPVRRCPEDRTRPNLKVQDGCSNRCSFCIIPFVRGRSRSAALESMSRTGARLSRTVRRSCSQRNQSWPLGPRFAGWHCASSTCFAPFCCARPRVRRLRISSVEPMDWWETCSNSLPASQRIAKHVHLPLQSGSRRRSEADVSQVPHASLREPRWRWRARLMPDAAIGADVMTGFPGETEAEFRADGRFIEPHSLSRTCTSLPTRSARARSPLSGASRSAWQFATNARMSCANFGPPESGFRRRMIGKTLSAVTLEQRGSALTSNFLKSSTWRGPREPNTC